MAKNKKFWLSLAIQMAVAAVIVGLIYLARVDDLNTAVYEHKRYAAVPQAWPMRCASDALFIPAVMWLGLAGLMWVSTTGFFDIFSYAFKSLLVLFSTLKKPSDLGSFYDYKLEKEEKRTGKAVSITMLLVGGLLFLAALGLNIAHNSALDPYLNSEAHRQEQQLIVQGAEEAGAGNDIEGGQKNE